jgi:hypothetical protein
MPGTPYLQSGRLAPPAVGAGVNKTLLTRMDTVLVELHIPVKPIATKRVCDLYDAVRKDILTLLILQKKIIQKEGALQSKRLKLSKMGGDVQIPDEESLLGITPPTLAASPASKGKAKGVGKGKTGLNDVKKASSLTAKVADASSAQTKPADTLVSSTTSGGLSEGTTLQGKQARKPSAKRKKKAEAVSTAPQPPPGVDVSLDLEAAPQQPDEAKSPTKKRAKKST